MGAYGYTQAGLTSGKRLQVQETLHFYVNGVLQNVPQSLNMDAIYGYNNEGKMTSVNYPSTSAWNGNGLTQTSGPAYTYSFDAMYRPTGLKDQNSNTIVNNVSYNAANQLLTFNTETHTYNNLNQMTRLTITGTAPLDISYNFPAGTNNGKIASQTDNLSGETVTYQYDSLNRLITASGSQSWGETYGFDAFGNLLSKTGSGGAPSLSQSVNTATNQIVGQSYDANGNQSGTPLVGVTVGYDAENRVATASGGVQYAYDSRNKRVWRSILSGGNLAQQVYVYGVDGQKIGTYTFTLGQYGETNVAEMTNSTVLLATFFGHKRVGTYDRLGSAKYNQSNNMAQSFYPYGEDRGTVEPNDELKFATYTRDAASGLDYADQRYYASNFGRFMSPDPYMAKAGGANDSTDSASWNRYTYTRSDAVNRLDPLGLYDCNAPLDESCLVSSPNPAPNDSTGAPEQRHPRPPRPPRPPKRLLVPTSFVFLGAKGGAAPCDQDYGAFATETFQVLDQYGNPIDLAGLLVQEFIGPGIIIVDGFPVGTAPASPGWVSTTRPGPTFTNASGQFIDSPFGSCSNLPDTYIFTQQYQVEDNGVWYLLLTDVRHKHDRRAWHPFGGDADI